MIETPVHDGMIRCPGCGYRNIFTDRSAFHPRHPELAYCRNCGNVCNTQRPDGLIEVETLIAEADRLLHPEETP